MLALVALGLAQPLQAQGTRAAVGQVLAANDSTPVSGVEGNLVSGQTIRLAPVGADTSARRLVLRGPRLSGSPFRVTLEEAQGKRLIPVGILTARQQ
jgi:hypothetical protein